MAETTTNRFDYEKFSSLFETLSKNIGMAEDSGLENITAVINDCNNKITSGLAYAEDSTWASAKLQEWNSIMPELKNQLANLENLLTKAKTTATAYHEYELAEAAKATHA